MLIEIISDHAEEALLTLLEQSDRRNVTWGALLFQSSHFALRLDQEDFLLTLRPMLENKPAVIYFFRNGDIVITWKGPQKSTLNELCHRLYERYAPAASEKLHIYFDLEAQGEELRLLCKSRLEAPLQPAVPSLVLVDAAQAAGPAAAIYPSAKQMATLERALHRRKTRTKPEILVVEDQAFSNKLLVGMLNQEYPTHGALNAERGQELYCAHAPNLVFLDIELPGTNGHDFAALIRRIDPNAYIIMVTANHSTQDVLRAKANGVKGFIAKPYNRSLIQNSVKKYLQEQH